MNQPPHRHPNLSRRRTPSGRAGSPARRRLFVAVRFVASVAAVTASLAVSPAAASPLCVTATGTVSDSFGVALANAAIWLPTPDCGVTSTTTDSQGRYQLPVQSTVGEQATASKAGHQAATIEVRFNPTGGTGNDFALRYAFSPAAVNPPYVQPGGTTTLSVRALPAPPPTEDRFVCEWGWSDVRGEEFYRSTPVPGIGGTGTLSGAASVASGINFNAALLTDSTVVTWGSNVAGDLGDGTSTGWFTRAPDRVVAVGGSGTLSGVTAVATGDFHALALRSDGTVVAWGANWNRQLGMVTNPDESPVPVVVPSLTGVGPLTGVVAIAAGGEQSVALLGDGRVVRWGFIADAAAGHVTEPELVRSVTGDVLDDVTAVDVGDRHALALRAGGTVAAWGSNAAGQLGHPGVNGSLDAVEVVGFNGTGVLGAVTAISTGASHSLVRLADATAGAWGSAQYGELGDGTASPVPGNIPRRVVTEAGSGTISGVAVVAAAGHHSFAVLTGGVTLAWGDNNSGQLGTDTAAASAVPVRPKGGDGQGVLAGIDDLDGDWANSVAIRSGPCDQGRAPVRAWLQTGVGASATMTALTAGVPDAQGYTTWTGTIVGSGTDGLRVVRTCLLDRRSTDTCEQANTVGPLRIVSPVQGLSYRVDGTAPSLVSTTPPAFATTLAATTLAVYWSDAGSGVRSSSITMSLDGVPVTPSISGGTASISAVGLAPGIHRITTTAADLAGNLAAERSFIFTLAALEADPATATVEQTTINVNPDGTVVPASTVTFTRPLVNVSGFNERLSASTRVGYGTVKRSFAFPANSLIVRFDNGALTVDQPVTPARIGTATHKLAVLAPSAIPLAGRMAASTTNLADITVSVPVGFNTPGATATLIDGTGTPLGDPWSDQADLLNSKLPAAKLEVSATLTACRERSTEPGSNGLCQQTPVPEAQVTIAGVGNVGTVLPYSITPADPDDYAKTAARCVLVADPEQSGCDEDRSVEAHTTMLLGCPVVDIGAGPINLCTAVGVEPQSPQYGFLSGYVNEFVYKGVPNSSAVLAQNHLEAPPDGERCPVGDSGSVKATLHRASTSLTALDGQLPAAVAGTFRDDDSETGQLTVQIGQTTGPDQDSVLDEAGGHPTYTVDTALDYQVGTEWGLTPRALTDGTYAIRLGVRDDAFGTPQDDPASVNNAFTAASGVTGTVALASGARYANPDTYAYLASLVFQFTADFTECHP